jgi:flavin-dependent dehydrogenase
MLDVLIAGAGPSGTVAALVLARAGARVLIVDRSRFPRDKLCGDTLNPGAVAFLQKLGLTGGALDRAMPLRGMRLTGPGAEVSARYPASASGLALPRRDLDQWLLDEAIRAGVRFEAGVTAKRPLTEGQDSALVVKGLVIAGSGTGSREIRLPATTTIAADGRRSQMARALGLGRDVRAPRRWAFGVYATDVAGTTELGEMHIHAGGYIGVAPLADGLINVCVVRGPRPAGRTPLDVIRTALAAHRDLASRFADARFVSPVRVLGPLASDTWAPGRRGLLLAGDAAGFVDPMTGDGLHLAMQGAVLAAEETLRVLETGDFAGAPARLARARQRTLGAKLRFNRAVRWLVGRPAALELASLGARVAPGVIRHAVRYAGDAQ